MTRAEEPRATVFSYEDTIEAAIGQDALRRIEASLSEVQRRVLHLRFFDGQSMEEIAATLGQSAGNVRNHYYRALEKMRREVFNTPQFNNSSATVGTSTSISSAGSPTTLQRVSREIQLAAKITF